MPTMPIRGAWRDGVLADAGAGKGKFKTPTLREVARTAPYMHDGSIATLEDVIEFSSGVGPSKSQPRSRNPAAKLYRRRKARAAGLPSGPHRPRARRLVGHTCPFHRLREH
jgi:cytochrome c peroxidase